MKYTVLTIFLFLTVSSYCSQTGGARVQVLQFKEFNDSLHITYTIDMDARSIARYQGLNITLGVETDSNLLLLPSFIVTGDNKGKVLTRYRNNHPRYRTIASRGHQTGHAMQSRAGETHQQFTISIPYELWMDSAQISVRQEVADYRGRTVFTHYLLSGRVELEPRVPYEVQTQVAMQTPERVDKIIARRGQAFLDFPVGRSVIQPNFRRNPEELGKIDDAVREVVGNPDAQLQSIHIEGFASPEGSWILNDRLSSARATALKDYIRTRFNLPESYFRVTHVAEDWDGLVVMVQESNLPEKDRILEIISTISSYDVREATLVHLAGGRPWNVMVRDMFPELRRVEYQINYTVRDFGVQDAIAVMDRNPLNLSHLEMYQVAQHFGRDSDRFNQIILDTVLRYFPDEETAHLNAAALFIENGELNTAKRHLERAGNSPEALNNRGIIALKEGNLDEAEVYFTRAQQAGSAEAEHNLNEVSLKREDNVRMERFNR